MVQYTQVCISALSMAEVNVSSGENETASDCFTRVGPTSASKNNINRSLTFSISFCYKNYYLAGIFFPENFDVRRHVNFEDALHEKCLHFDRVLECVLPYMGNIGTMYVPWDRIWFLRF